ncbi:MAG: hypothetical protein ACLTYB_16320, partial [Clostridium paraputrificum]
MEIDIKLNLDTNTVTIYEEVEYCKKAREIGINDFISSVLAAKEKSEDKRIITLLSKELYGCKLIQSIIINKKTSIYILDMPKHRDNMPLYKRFYTNIGVPHLIFAVYVTNNRMTRLKVKALKDEVINEDTKLYRYPFSNVSGSVGNVCLGANDLGKGILINNSLYKVPSQFFSMPNNFDSYSEQDNKKYLGYE